MARKEFYMIYSKRNIVLLQLMVLDTLKEVKHFSDKELTNFCEKYNILGFIEENYDFFYDRMPEEIVLHIDRRFSTLKDKIIGG